VFERELLRPIQAISALGGRPAESPWMVMSGTARLRRKHIQDRAWLERENIFPVSESKCAPQTRFRSNTLKKREFP
jgi:hypothetical protein